MKTTFTNSILIKKSIFIILASVLFSSCASIFNSKSTKLAIFTTEKTSLEIVSKEAILNVSDTLSEHNVRVKRSQEILRLTLTSDEESKTIFINPKNSFAYILNYFPPSPFYISNIIGILIDGKNPKRYTYPKKVYVDMEKDGNSFTTYKPLDKAYQGYQNVLKINVLKMASFEAGGVELSFEKKTSDKFTTQFTAAYILPTIWEFQSFKPSQLSGFQLGAEKRFYWGETAPVGYYLAAEISYLNNQYRFTDTFTARNKYYEIMYEDQFGVKKQTFSLNAKVGRQFFINRFSIDLAVGVGLRHKNVNHFDKINPEGKIGYSGFIFPSVKQLNNKPGNYFAISLPMSVRVGWLF